MIFPPSTEFLASLSGCHAKIPVATIGMAMRQTRVTMEAVRWSESHLSMVTSSISICSKQKKGQILRCRVLTYGCPLQGFYETPDGQTGKRKTKKRHHRNHYHLHLDSLARKLENYMHAIHLCSKTLVHNAAQMSFKTQRRETSVAPVPP